MTTKPWPAQVTWSDLPAGQRRKVMVHLGRLIRRCLADPQVEGSREAAHDPTERHDQREDPDPPP
jgi:hypothetical protein